MNNRSILFDSSDGSIGRLNYCLADELIDFVFTNEFI